MGNGTRLPMEANRTGSRERARGGAARGSTREADCLSHLQQEDRNKNLTAFFFPPLSQITNVEMREFIRMLICLNSFPNESPEVLSSSQRGQLSDPGLKTNTCREIILI